LGLVLGTNLFVSKEEDGSGVNDLCATLYETGSWREPEDTNSLYHPTVQVRVRGARNGYQAAYSLISSIRDTIMGWRPQTLGSTFYGGFWCSSDILFVAYDEKTRPIFTCNFRIMRSA
jgi:hypothetical protein